MLPWLQRKLLFPSHLVPTPRHAAHAAVGGEQSWLGEIECWLLPGNGVTAATPGPLVLFAHGNGELIDHWPRTLEPYRTRGISVLLPEYRGYGRSRGSPSEAAIVGDFERALHTVARDPRVDGRFVFHGRSLGGGVVCALAKRHAPRALILESTFTSVTDVARGMGVPSVFIHDRFESLPVVRAFEGPILVLHGTRDRLVPTANGRALAAANPRAELVLYDVGHNDLPPPGSDYWARIDTTLRRADIP